MKQCPACAEEVQDEARVCRFCGYDFVRRRNPRLTTNDLGGCAVNGCLLWLFGPIILIMLFVLIFGGNPYGGVKSEPSAVQPGEINTDAVNVIYEDEAKPKRRNR